jgi:tetratricopeptide (TPR) repeat protein/predicted aspartyl protease
MSRFRFAAAALAFVVAVTLVIHAEGTISQSAEIQLQLGNLFFGEGRYQESLEAFVNAVKVAPSDQLKQARGGVIQSSLRLAEFERAREEAEKLIQENPRAPESMALYADALWASGLFEQAESEYRDALTADPDMPRGLHGMALSLAARGRLDEAMVNAQEAMRLAPRDLEILHTVGSIFERQHKYDDAAAAYSNYVNLLPNKDTSYQASWSRAEIRFLQSFSGRVPFETKPGSDDRTFTVPFKLVNEKVVVRAKVNGASAQDFVVDTGSEQTVITRPTAQRLGVLPITRALSAGVGDVGLRGLQLARMDSLEIGELKLRNIPCLIKNPPLAAPDLRRRETESLSPLALGYSMIIDYKTKQITFGKHIPVEPADFVLPLRFHRLATVQGMIDGSRRADFIIDTGGEVISISQASANALTRSRTGRRIQLRVHGVSGWDTGAFLMPGVSLAFDAIQYENLAVVVLNLDTPSALLGFQVGGIVGEKFLSNYRVSIDIERSTLRLKKAA